MHSLQTRLKISRALLGRSKSLLHRRRISLSRVGKMLGDKNPSKRSDVRRKLSIASTGRRLSLEARLKIGAARRGCKNPEQSIRMQGNKFREGKRFSEESRQRLSEAASRQHSEGRMYSRGNSGWFESAKLGVSVYYASSYEKRAILRLEDDPEVTFYGRCKARLRWFDRDSGCYRRYSPDLYIEYRDGTVSVVEVKALWDTVSFEFYAKMTVLKQFCQNMGWSFMVWTECELGIPV